jgi:hypothetical protein
MPVRTLLTLTAVAMASLTAVAQDVVHLKNGERIVGETTDGMLAVKVETSAGEVRIPWSRIDRIDRRGHVERVYAERKAGIAKDDAAGHYLLALWCRRHGLADEMQAELEAVLAVEPDHKGARTALGHEKVDEKWVAGNSILTAKGLVKRGDRWVLAEEAVYEEILEARRKPLTEEEESVADLIRKAVDESERVRKYARATFAGISWENARLALFRALGDRNPEIRAFAAMQLGEFRMEEAARPLLRSAILDRDETVRLESVASIRGLDRPDALFPLIRALASGSAQIRMNAAAAIGAFGDIRGIEYLVRRLSQNWGPTGRVNLQVLNTVSYIRDFDVEIAQAAQIGDPIVGTLTEGVILDMQVLGVNRRMDVVERRVIRGALSKLSGQDFGDNATAWSDWWEKNKVELLAKAG